MSRAKYEEAKTEQFCSTVSDVLQAIIDHPDDGREVKYQIKKHIDRIEFRIDLSGDRIDPTAEGEGAERISFRQDCKARQNCGGRCERGAILAMVCVRSCICPAIG